MKLKALLLALLLITVVAFPASAATLKGDGISLEVPDEYLIITPDNVSENVKAAKVLGFTEKTLKTYMQDNGMIFLGLVGNNTRQVQLRAKTGGEDSFAAKIGDLSLLDNENIRESAAVIMDQLDLSATDRYEVVANTGGLKAIKITAESEDGTSVQYVTIRNGVIYSLVGFDAAGSSMDYLADIFESLEIKKEKGGFTLAEGTQIVTTVIVVLLMLAAVVVIIRLLISFVRDFRNRENDVSEYIKIKRRKF